MYLSILELTGDTDDILSSLQQHVLPVATRIAPEFGGIQSTIVRTDTGVMIVNLWKDDEGRHAFPEHPEMREAIARAGITPNAKGYEVLSHRVVGEVPA
jgi:hypothetical protein